VRERPDPAGGHQRPEGQPRRATRHNGLAAGKGFYDWAGLQPAEVRKVAAQELQKLIAFLDRETFPNTAKQQPKARDHVG